MNERLIVRSPALRIKDGQLIAIDELEWCCVDEITRRITLPASATTMWIVASNRQWADGSGFRAGLNFMGGRDYSDEFGAACLHWPLLKLLSDTFGAGQKDYLKPVTLYFRVLYEE